MWSENKRKKLRRNFFKKFITKRIVCNIDKERQHQQHSIIGKTLICTVWMRIDSERILRQMCVLESFVSPSSHTEFIHTHAITNKLLHNVIPPHTHTKKQKWRKNEIKSPSFLSSCYIIEYIYIYKEFHSRLQFYPINNSDHSFRALVHNKTSYFFHKYI